MFDFDVVEAEDPASEPVANVADAGARAGRWAEDLCDEEWQVRWEACRGLARLGAAAVPHLPALAAVAAVESNADVRGEATRALSEVRATAGDEELSRLVEEAVVDLSAETFKARRNACFALGALAEWATAHMPELENLKKEDDYEVRRAARNAYREVSMARARKMAAEPADDVDNDATLGSSAGYTALFRATKELHPMRLAHSAMTPAEVTEIWEKQWGVENAGLINLMAEEGSTTRPLHPESDTVPRSPFVVTLDVPLASMLESVEYALKEYGTLTADEVAASRARKEQLLLAAVKFQNEAAIFAKFQVLDEVLPMRLERDVMTPAEVAEIWEEVWGIQYAGKLRFEVPKDWEYDKKWFHPRNDVLPLSPCVIRLETTTHKSRSILYSLQACLRQYGKMTAEEVAYARENRW